MSDLIGLLLIVVSVFLKIVLFPFLFTYNIIAASYNKEIGNWLKSLSICNDRYGNVLGEYFFNKFFITNEGYKFGKSVDTISFVLGKNKYNYTLKPFGKFICFILNSIDKNHVEKAIDNNFYS